jgi:lipoate-protein ligase B
MDIGNNSAFTDRVSRAAGGSLPCLVVDLGLIGYGRGYELQKRLVTARKADAIGDVLLICEHPHVITLGRNGKRENLLASDHVLRQRNVEFYPTDRGGDVTYHGPGQIVGYPILNLAGIRRDVGWYVRMLEEAMMLTANDFGIASHREPGKTGVWVDLASAAANSEKLAAIGVHLSRWVTSHGFAFNVSTDLRYFDMIVPCGITGRKATSLEKLLGRAVNRGEATERLTQHLAEVFGFTRKPTSLDELERQLHDFEEALKLSA